MVQKLALPFGQGLALAVVTDGVDGSLGVYRRAAVIEAIHVDGADKEHGPLPGAGEDVFRAVHVVALITLPGQFHHALPMGQSRKMDDALRAGGLHDHRKPLPIREVNAHEAVIPLCRFLARTPDAHDLIAALEQLLHHSRADHAPRAGDKYGHTVPSPFGLILAIIAGTMVVFNCFRFPSPSLRDTSPPRRRCAAGARQAPICSVVGFASFTRSDTVTSLSNF